VQHVDHEQPVSRADPSAATGVGGAQRWTPLYRGCASRYGRGDPAVGEARARIAAELLAHGANPNDEVPAFQGPAVFSATVKGSAGTSTTVNFDLSEMGSTPRTMGNVTNYLNSKLQAAGVVTRFVNQRTPGAPQTIVSGGKTIDLGTTGPDQFALKINGISSETISFGAPAATPAVYVSQLSGRTTGDNPDPQAQVMKLDGADPNAAKIVSKTLGPEVTGIRASATGPDGSLYVVGQLDNKTQPSSADAARSAGQDRRAAMQRRNRSRERKTAR